MKNFGAKWLALAMVVGVGASASLNGCGGDDGGTGTAGTTGRGGTTGSAGRGGTGGTGGGTAGATGGSSAGRGGTTGNAGRGGTGGGTAGATAGTGGSGTDGGAGTGGGLPCPGIATFDTTAQSFGLNTFAAAGNLANLEASAPAALSWVGTEGDPAVGAVKVDAPFSDYNQFVDVQRGLGATALANWTGYKMHVRVKVASGGNPSAMNPAGVQPYINTGTSYNYCGAYVNLKTGNGWNDYVLDLSTCAAPVDASMVIAYGVSIQAGNGSTGDGGINSMKPTAAVIYVDSFWLEGSCGGGTGGTGGGTAGTTGTGGTGGAVGGTTGTGGAVGGTTGTGGTAGTTGTGGAVGGTTGTGGAGGNLDGGTGPLAVANFDTTADGFSLNTFMSTTAGAEINLAVREAGTTASIAWDGTQGMGTPVGSVKVNAPFNAYNQYFDLVHNYGTTLQDWTGKTVFKVRFKVTAGGNPDPSFPAGAQAYVQTSTSYEGAYGYNNVVAGTDWQVASVALPATMTGKPNWNLAQIQQVGIKIATGAGTGADAAVASGPPTAATIYIDSIWVE